MPRTIAFLRAINVGGHTVKMEELRGHFESFGLSRVETFIASGNVIFESGPRATAGLVTKIERRLREALGYDVATFLRSDSELAAIARYPAFPAAAIDSAEAFIVGFLAAPLGPGAKRILAGFETAIDEFHLHGRELYWLCAKRQSESTFSNAVFERAVGTRATFRGISTIRKLVAKYPASKSLVAPPRRRAARP